MPAGQDRNALRPRKRRTPRGLGTPVAAPLDVPEQAGEVRALQLIKVDTAQDLRLRNALMCEHPQGAGVMVGAQLRYLIGSEHGCLGGLGVRCVGHHAGRSQPLDRLGCEPAARAHAPRDRHESLLDPPLGTLPQPGLDGAWDDTAHVGPGLRGPMTGGLPACCLAPIPGTALEVIGYGSRRRHSRRAGSPLPRRSETAISRRELGIFTTGRVGASVLNLSRETSSRSTTTPHPRARAAARLETAPRRAQARAKGQSC